MGASDVNCMNMTVRIGMYVGILYKVKYSNSFKYKNMSV